MKLEYQVIFMILLVLGFVTATARNILSLPHHGVLDLHQWNRFRASREALQFKSSMSRRQLLQDNCTEDPFLWLIRDNATDKGDIVGYGFGTMHLPREKTLSLSSWNSILNALGTSCAVYGELDMTDPEIMDDIEKCALATSQQTDKLFYIADISNDTIREKFSLKVYETIRFAYGNSSQPEVLKAMANFLEETLDVNTWATVWQQFNTPELKQDIVNEIFFEVPQSILDEDIIKLGRPSGSLETIEMTCNYLEKNSFKKDYTDEELEEILTSSLSELLSFYKCGASTEIYDLSNATTFNGEYVDEFNDDYVDVLLDDRNVEMTNKMIEIIESSNETKTFFAVGLLHWEYGDKSIEKLLDEKGYYLEKVTGAYDPPKTEYVSDSTCFTSLKGSNPAVVPTSAPTTPYLTSTAPFSASPSSSYNISTASVTNTTDIPKKDPSTDSSTPTTNILWIMSTTTLMSILLSMHFF